MNQPVFDRITTILQENFGVSSDTGLSEDTEFEDLGVDSLVLVELSIILRREFGIRVTDEELASSRTLGGAADIVTSRAANV